MGVNKAFLLGRLGEDPKVVYGRTGAPVCRFSLATERTKNGGEAGEQVTWHRIVAFGALAETIAKYLKKGSKIYVEGKNAPIRLEESGEARYLAQIIATSVEFLDGAAERAGSAPDNRRQRR